MFVRFVTIIQLHVFCLMASKKPKPVTTIWRYSCLWLYCVVLCFCSLIKFQVRPDRLKVLLHQSAKSGVHKFFQISMSLPRISGARRVVWSRFCTLDPQILGTTVQNVARVTWCPGFVNPWVKSSVIRVRHRSLLFQNVCSCLLSRCKARWNFNGCVKRQL